MGIIRGFGILDLTSFFYMIFGTIVGDFILEARENNSWEAFQKKISISGIIMLLLGIISELYLINTYNLTVPHTTSKYAPFFNIYAIGMFMFVFSILFRIQDYKKHSPRKIAPIRIFSNLSLTIFYAHLILLLLVFVPIGMGNFFSVYSLVVFLNYTKKILKYLD